MMKRSIIATVLVAFMCAFAMPAQAQFGKKLGKSLGKAAKDAGKVAQGMATDAAMEMGANKASENIIQFMDNNNTVSAEDSDYSTRLATILGSNFTSVEGKELNVKVYESDEANIVTLNDGNIRIYSGMMDILEDDEVKALIALQAAHISSGNVRDNLLKAVSGDSAESAGSAQLEKLLSFSGDQLGSVVNELLQVPYTEEQNTAADKFAKTYLKQEGGDTGAFTDLLTKFQELKRVDLESDDLDEEDETVMKAFAVSKFLGVNSAR